ncbi:MAG: hypothetical protein K8R02_06915 [Anaerohalosphaeraceae bacterium]|nr:hypothetical protein [Anaerohalosphaeraceae bacterium]
MLSDAFGNLISSGESYSQFGYSVGYGYDQRGLLTYINYPNGKYVELTRDALGRVKTVSYDGEQFRPFGTYLCRDLF